MWWIFCLFYLYWGWWRRRAFSFLPNLWALLWKVELWLKVEPYGLVWLQQVYNLQSACHVWVWCNMQSEIFSAFVVVSWLWCSSSSCHMEFISLVFKKNIYIYMYISYIYSVFFHSLRHNAFIKHKYITTRYTTKHWPHTRNGTHHTCGSSLGQRSSCKC